MTGALLLFLGFGLMLVGCVLVAIVAFRTSIVWGICVLVVPGAAVVFALIYRQAAKRGILAYVAGFLIMATGGILLAPDIKRYKEKSDRIYTVATIRNMELAIHGYHTDNGRFPTTEEGLDLLVTGSPYFDPPVVPFDAWGNAFHYTLHKDDEFTLVSYGADGKPGGTGINADLTSADEIP